jgi:hypothetical protein
VVAIDEAGRPSFNALQNFGSSHATIFYCEFDVLNLAQGSRHDRAGKLFRQHHQRLQRLPVL